MRVKAPEQSRAASLRSALSVGAVAASLEITGSGNAALNAMALDAFLK